MNLSESFDAKHIDPRLQRVILDILEREAQPTIDFDPVSLRERTAYRTEQVRHIALSSTTGCYCDLRTVFLRAARRHPNQDIKSIAHAIIGAIDLLSRES